MKHEINVVDLSIVEGISIFNEVKKCKLEFNQYKLNINDKKYLSLYLGLINILSKMYIYFENINRKLNMQVNNKPINSKKYKEILCNYFSDVFEGVNFNTVEDYLNFLLDKDIVKIFNKINNVDIYSSDSNKKLILK